MLSASRHPREQAAAAAAAAADYTAPFTKLPELFAVRAAVLGTGTDEGSLLISG